MTGPTETLAALDQHLAARLLALERLDEAWPCGRTAIERAEIGREREEALYEIAALRQPCRHRPTRVGWSPRCWRWSSGRRMRRHLSTDFEFSRRRDSLSASKRLSRKCGNVERTYR